MLDSLQEVLYTLRKNKLRTGLTAFGVFWGIFMLILLLGGGRGLQNGVYADFGSDVLDFIVVYSSTTSVAHKGRGLGRRITLTMDDVHAIESQVGGLRSVSPSAERGAESIAYQTKVGNFPVHGITEEFFKVKDDIPFNHGRKINPLDHDQTRKIALLGTHVAERLFGKGVNPVGKQIRVSGVMMKVVGIFYDKGNRGRNSERVYIPLSTHQKLFGENNRIATIWLRPKVGADGFAVEKEVIRLLQQRHDVSPQDRRGIQAFNMAESTQKMINLFAGVNTFIWFVGVGTLMAGIIGVSNIMIITVKERTREIGIRKALGATPLRIVSALLFESVLVTSIAGYAGLVLGVGFIELIAFGLNTAGIELSYFQNPEVDFQIAASAIVLLVVAGTLAGLQPALHAARIKPIEAMRADK